jgi:hypothetical protein
VTKSSLARRAPEWCALELHTIVIDTGDTTIRDDDLDAGGLQVESTAARTRSMFSSRTRRSTGVVGAVVPA